MSSTTGFLIVNCFVKILCGKVYHNIGKSNTHFDFLSKTDLERQFQHVTFHVLHSHADEVLLQTNLLKKIPPGGGGGWSTLREPMSL